MVNMYSMGMGPMMGMNPMMGMSQQQGNVHQNLKNKYGVGYEDFGQKPYVQPYPFAIIPRQVEPEKNWFQRLFKLFYN